MNTELKTTPGKWSKQQRGNGDIEINSPNFRNLAIVSFYPEGFREKYINGKPSGTAPESQHFRNQCIYNANLFIDAGNTIQQCNLLPSELLKQNKEMRELLEKINNISYDDSGIANCTYGDTDYDSLSVVYGQNEMLSYIKNKIEQFLTPKN